MRALALGVGAALLLGVGGTALGAFGAPRDVLALLPGGVHPALGPDERAEIGVDYRFELPTHCGVEYAFFSGRWWTATPKLYENGAEVDPPPGWDNPTEPGTMRLVSRNEALFVGDSGNIARFMPGPNGGPGTKCG
jgi:hypothetical protein